MKRMLVAAMLGFALTAVAPAPSAQSLLDGSLIEMLGALRAQLNLNTAQQQQWDNAAALSAAARNAVRASFQERRTALQAELAKPEPDFASLAAATDAVHEELSSLHKQARNAWLSVYATFTPEQKGIVRDAIRTKIEQLQARRAALRGS